MTSNRISTLTIIWLMILCFRLVILFMDDAFSAVPQHVQQRPTPEASSSDDSLTVQQPAFSSSPDVATMVSGVVHQQLGNSQIFQDLHVLEYLYTKNKNPELLQPLVEKFLQYYQFDKANQYLTLLVAEAGDYSKLKMDPYQVIYARFHDSSIGLDSAYALDSVFSLINEYQSQNLITADDAMFYKGIKSLRVYDYQTATAAFNKVTGQRYQDFKKAYESALANYVKIKNPPVYYRDGLVALTLLKNWYFSVAKRLALRALAVDSTYVLPYQVLAYSNFLTHNRESAKDYFLKLADFDTTNASLYKFLIGVSYYRYWDYEQSIIYLNQVTDPSLQTDVYRYMLLWYINMQDTTDMVRIRQDLLGQSQLQPSDFALFFDHFFYLPFRTAQPFSLYLDTPQLADLYEERCSTIFTGSQDDVCRYGEVWLQLAKQNLSWVWQTLISLTQTYHQSHLYHLLGDYYASIKQYPSAKDAYIKALSISDDTTEQSLIQNKLSQLSK